MANYSSIVSEVAGLMVVPISDPNFQAIIPGMFDYAELRMQRDLDLVDSTVRDSSGTLTVGSRTFNLPSTNGTFIVVYQMNVLTPAGTVSPDSGTRNPLVPASVKLLDALWPSKTGATVPQYFAAFDQDVMLVAPFPDQNYNIEVIGTQRFTPLYQSQSTSILSVFFPDVLVAACMVFASGYQQNFGAAGIDNPQQSINWESNYQALLASAKTEEARKKFIVGITTPSQPGLPPKG